jgi:hypothetical protein
MANPPNLLPLKVLVISLGLILVGGTVFLLATIAGKASKDLPVSECKDATAHLNAKGKNNIGSITVQGDNVVITMTTESKIEVVTVDRCNGKVLQTLSVVP